MVVRKTLAELWHVDQRLWVVEILSVAERRAPAAQKGARLWLLRVRIAGFL